MKKQIASLFTIITFLFFAVFALFEPAMVKGIEDEIKVSITITDEISISEPADVTLTQISGLVGGTSTGDATWTVKTNNSTGYNIGIKSTSTPAMAEVDSGVLYIEDYTPATSTEPDYDWDLDGAVAQFGFSPYNADSQVAKYKNDGSDCNMGSSITDLKCWYYATTTNEVVANRATATDVPGEDTKINFRVQYEILNGTQEDGTYRATIIATAVAN